MNFTKLYLLLFIIVSSTNIFSQNAPTYQDLYDKGVEQFDNEEYLSALYYMQKAAALKGRHNSSTANYVASCCKELNWYASATKYFEDAVEYAERYQTLGNLGCIYLETGELDLAIEYLDKALTLKPNYVFALNNKGALLLEQGKYEEALQVFRIAMQQKEVQFAVYDNVSSLFDEINQPDSAKYYLDKSLSLNPNYMLSVVKKTNREELSEEEMTSTLKKIIKLESETLAKNPQNFMSLFNRGKAYKRLGKKKQMEADLNKALAILNILIEQHPKSYSFILTRADIYILFDQIDEAINDAQLALKANPDSPEALNLINFYKNRE